MACDCACVTAKREPSLPQSSLASPASVSAISVHVTPSSREHQHLSCEPCTLATIAPTSFAVMAIFRLPPLKGGVASVVQLPCAPSGELNSTLVMSETIQTLPVHRTLA